MNWCPNDQTVLANEQVVDGMCDRCGAEVTKRELSQWYFKVTEYAQRLLDDMEPLEDTWPERVLALQRNWIGRSVGRPRRVRAAPAPTRRRAPLTVFTTRPDTLYGATFMVVAADAKLAGEIVAPEQREAFEAYLAEVRKETDIDRLSTDRPKTGVYLGVTAVNPVTGERDRRCGRPTTCWPTTAPARSWRCPRTTSATWTSRRSSACRYAGSWTPARTTPRRPTSRPTGDGVYVNSGRRWTG